MDNSNNRGVMGILAAFIMLLTISCEKEMSTETAKVRPPVRTYVVTARADKKGTNSTSQGTAVLTGIYEEDTKVLTYSIEFADISPRSIVLRSGPRGAVGSFVRELYNSSNDPRTVIEGSMVLTPLQERNMLKGFWSITINTVQLSPEISGFLTLKQQ